MRLLNDIFSERDLAVIKTYEWVTDIYQLFPVVGILSTKKRDKTDIFIGSYPLTYTSVEVNGQTYMNVASLVQQLDCDFSHKKPSLSVFIRILLSLHFVGNAEFKVLYFSGCSLEDTLWVNAVILEEYLIAEYPDIWWEQSGIYKVAEGSYTETTQLLIRTEGQKIKNANLSMIEYGGVCFYSLQALLRQIYGFYGGRLGNVMESIRIIQTIDRERFNYDYALVRTDKDTKNVLWFKAAYLDQIVRHLWKLEPVTPVVSTSDLEVVRTSFFETNMIEF